MFEKEPSNNLSRFVKMRAKNLNKVYGKNGVMVDAINENTKQLKVLIEEVRELKMIIKENQELTE